MIKAILFDLDGVLTTDKTGSETTTRFLSAQTGLPVDSVQAVFRRHYFGSLCGEKTQPEVWTSFCAEMNLPAEPYLLNDAARATPMDKDMLALARELHEKYKLGIVTDNPAERVAVLAEHFSLDIIFDTIAVSGEIRSRKKEPRIFEAAFAALNVRPDECVFIDNTAANLTVPAKMGVKTIFFDDETRDIAALRCALDEILQNNAAPD